MTATRPFKSDATVREAVLNAVRGGCDTIPAIHLSAAREIEVIPVAESLVVAAYANRTSSAQATTRKAVCELIDAGLLRSIHGKVTLP